MGSGRCLALVQGKAFPSKGISVFVERTLVFSVRFVLFLQLALSFFFFFLFPGQFLLALFI